MYWRLWKIIGFQVEFKRLLHPNKHTETIFQYLVRQLKSEPLNIHCKYLQPNYSLITAKRLYLRLNYSHWQYTVIGCNSIQPIYNSNTVFDCNYEFSHIYGKFSYFWLQFGCTKQVLVWYAAFNWYRFLRLERFCY